MGIFVQTLFHDPRLFFIITGVVVFSICLHEFMHAWVAYRLGDTTAADRGHLTLNPVKQMGIMSIIMFLLIGIAWGSVPVNLQTLRQKGKYAEIMVALAGPAVNLSLFIIGWLIFGLILSHPAILPAADSAAMNLVLLVFYLGIYNFVLCVFNLLPIPGLDGWNAYSSLFPNLFRIKSEAMKGILIFLIFGMIFGVNYLFSAGKFLMQLAPGFFGADMQ